MKRILVPTDFSEQAQYALRVAADLAKKYQAKLYLLHMLGISQTLITKDESKSQAEAIYYMELAKKRFAELLEKDFLKGVEVETIVQNYTIFSEINSLAHDKGIDLIVMGSHGTGNLNDFFVGSNTEKVVRTSDFPVLVIKDERPDLKLEKAVFALDFDSENMKAFKKGVSFFENLGAEVELLYVNLPNEKFRSSMEIHEKVEEFMKAAGREADVSKVSVRSDYTVENGIYNFVKEKGADVIGIPTHGRRGLSHFFLGSIGEDLANHAKVPVLTFKI
ncbi:universal stress protein [Robertkochia aurantiaca]|uniref:universal stress protein n=1 Tax=Robertkochia aurantiaca TaxID=2873700 RepID=UPI001CCB805D|nr:universal stress protein [Robertkochia sp. 3YJGBD-33]